jgi:hypothetical protein
MACDTRVVRFAFYGRTARTDAADTEAERHWQQHCCRAAAAARDGQITAWFFDAACPADMPLASRPQCRALLAALADTRRRIDPVLAADTARLPPRREVGTDTRIPGWPSAWHTPLLLADTGITISPPQEYDLIADVLLGLGRPPRRGQASPAAITSRTASRRLVSRGAGTARRPR